MPYHLPQGSTGTAGASGASGQKGDKGDTGSSGPRGLPGLDGAPVSMKMGGGNGVVCYHLLCEQAFFKKLVWFVCGV